MQSSMAARRADQTSVTNACCAHETPNQSKSSASFPSCTSEWSQEASDRFERLVRSLCFRLKLHLTRSKCHECPRPQGSPQGNTHTCRAGLQTPQQPEVAETSHPSPALTLTSVPSVGMNSS